MNDVEAIVRESLGAHPQDLIEFCAKRLGVADEIVRNEVQRLIDSGEVEVFHEGSQPGWRWKPVFQSVIARGSTEDRIWKEAIAPRIAGVPANVESLLHHCTTEMINNVLDHSDARSIVVVVRILAAEVEIYIEDDGVGIFEKLQRAKGLEDPRHVALELVKGKLTTDPSRHTGEGIFFSARMCDKFLIWSGESICGHVEDGVWHVRKGAPRKGTTVRLGVRLDTTRTPKAVFDAFAPPGIDMDLAFTHTEIPADLVGTELVSRSQAKRLLARCEQFQRVTLDFKGVTGMAPAFADEAFRVWPSQHPAVILETSGADEVLAGRIERARRGAQGP